MRVRLGINTCFAVKRWPLAADWIPIVRDRLGLTLVQHSFDLVPAGASAADAEALARSTAVAGIELHSTFTGLATYSDNLLLGPDPAGRAAAAAWYRWAIDWTAAAGGIATRWARRGVQRPRLDRSRRARGAVGGPPGSAPGAVRGRVARPASRT